MTITTCANVHLSKVYGRVHAACSMFPTAAQANGESNFWLVHLGLTSINVVHSSSLQVLITYSLYALNCKILYRPGKN